MSASPTVILITSDLMAAAQLEGQIRRAGCLPRTVTSTGVAISIIEQSPVKAIVVELLDAAVDVPSLVATGVPVLAYASHIHEQALAGAAEAGAIPLSRGQAASQLSQVLQRLPV